MGLSLGKNQKSINCSRRKLIFFEWAPVSRFVCLFLPKPLNNRFFTSPSTFGLSRVWIPWNPPFFSQISRLSDSRASESPEIPRFFHKSLDFRTLECLNPVKSPFFLQISRLLSFKFPKHWFISNFCFSFFKNTTFQSLFVFQISQNTGF